MRRSILIFSLLLLSVFLGCRSAARAQVLPVRTYGIREGLNAGSISAVLRDSRGLLWVGTYNGVNLYDGSRFQQPKMTSRGGQIYVNEFCEDRRHQVWIATWYSGLYKYANGVFTNYLPDTVNIGSQSNSILHLTELPDGRLLCGTDHNAYIFDGQHFKLLDSGNHDLDRQITATACTSNGTLFVGLADSIAIYMGGSNHWQFVVPMLQGVGANKMLIAHDTLWIATNKGLYYIAGAHDLLRTCLIPRGACTPIQFAAGNITNVFLDANHTVWYTKAGGGIWRQRLAPAVAPGSAPRLASGSASGFPSGSASVFPSGSASVFPSGSASVFPSGSASIFPSGSASIFPSGSASIFASGSAPGSASGSAPGLAPANAPEHIGSENGLPSSQVVCGCSDVEGIVWLGTENGLAKLTPAGYRLFPVKEDVEGATIIAVARRVQRHFGRQHRHQARAADFF